jgi:hypothetical protein
MNNYRPTLSELLLYYEPQKSEKITAFLAGAYLATIAIISII